VNEVDGNNVSRNRKSRYNLPILSKGSSSKRNAKGTTSLVTPMVLPSVVTGTGNFSYPKELVNG